MKKIGFLLMFIALFALSGCNTPKAESSFIGTIKEINAGQSLVGIEEGEILASGDEVMVDLTVTDGETFDVGDRIQVGYEGPVQGKMPLGIHTVFVEKVSE